MKRAWPMRAAALACSVAGIAMAAAGFQLLFAGDWLESHTVKFGPLTLLGVGILVTGIAIAFALVGAIRLPHLIGSWVVVALVLLPVLLTVGAAAAMGL